MRLRSLLYSFGVLSALSCSCQKAGTPSVPPGTGPSKTRVQPPIKEASGIADSKTHPGTLWVIEDSGNPPELVLLGHDGQVRSRLPLSGASNKDWEDLVLVNGDLYIGDIGDNAQQRSSCRIYRLPEPQAGATEASATATIEFRYPDGSHDAEAFLVDPETKDIYIITKRDAASIVFRLPYPQSHTSINVAENVGVLPFKDVVSAALAPNGKQLLVKTYKAVYQYSRPPGTSLAAALQQAYKTLPYEQELQGEAIGFKADGTGYFTLSEVPFASGAQHLHYYQQ